MTAQVIHLAVPMREADYKRPPLRWITRRARALMRGFGCSRRLAVFYAAQDYALFTGMYRNQLLRLMKGGRHG